MVLSRSSAALLAGSAAGIFPDGADDGAVVVEASSPLPNGPVVASESPGVFTRSCRTA
ncbi:MAG: hypothetical protein ACRDNW_25735 [Trebonia sp.]